MSRQPSLFVVAAPSGAGKTTMVNKLVQRNTHCKLSISYTTRAQRPTEKHGRDYFFVTQESFRSLKQSGKLLESALVFDNSYGTSGSQVEQFLSEGHHVILEIDWQGARQVRKSMPDCVTIFILPPSRCELENRLRGRNTDTEGIIKRRLNDAVDDMSHWIEFDHVIINDDLASAVDQLELIVLGDSQTSHTTNPQLIQQIENILVSAAEIGID